jgi:hypothetical protein
VFLCGRHFSCFKEHIQRWQSEESRGDLKQDGQDSTPFVIQYKCVGSFALLHFSPPIGLASGSLAKEFAKLFGRPVKHLFAQKAHKLSVVCGSILAQKIMENIRDVLLNQGVVVKPFADMSHAASLFLCLLMEMD